MPIRSVSQALAREMMDGVAGGTYRGISDRGKLLSAMLPIFCSGSKAPEFLAMLRTSI